ncbi:glycosyl transferase family 1 [Candidatus Bathyarchaeota archaeon RBG_13_52_12]|nr:MAG: glycosyl transferase family 1 [Candidatus Bathyarchaeota archaeon RBG_13_52_12]
MRIAFFVYEYPPSLVGGLGTYSQNMAPTLVKMGHEVSVFTLNRGSLPTKEILDGVEVHRSLISDATNVFKLISDSSLRGSGLKFFSDIQLYNVLSADKLLNKLIKEDGRSFDMVCFHDWLSSTAGLILKHNSELPAVFHVHSTEWGRANGGGSEVVSSIERTAAEDADQIVTVSNAMKRDLSDHGWDGGKINMVWNGVDPARYDPAKCSPSDISALRSRYGVGEDEKMILFVGRLSQVKGALELVLAMNRVSKESPKAKLVVLGCGELGDQIKHVVETMELSGSVRLVYEFLPEDQRILHYAASDLCVFPSTYEPFGIVSLEAMSMAKPVVVGARGVVGFAEQVVPNGSEKCGLHVNGGDPDDIAWGINEALRDPAEAEAWGLNGRKRVRNCFTWENAASETLCVYKKIF